MRTLQLVCLLALGAALVGCGGDGVDKNVDSGSTDPDMEMDMATADDGGGDDLGPTDTGGGDDMTPPSDMGVMPVATVSPTMLQVNEAGDSGTYTVSLSVAPDADVRVDIVSLDGTALTVSPSQLIFTAADFAPKTVTVSAIDDDELIGDQTITVTNSLSSTGNYAGVELSDVTVEILENDAVSGSVSPTALSLGEGTSGTFDVVLGIAPSGPVTITFTNDPAQIGLDVMTLTFDATNYDTPQTVTVTAIDDDLAEGPMTSVIDIDAAGGGYDNLVLPSVSVVISDNDVAGLVLSKMTMFTSEDGTTDAVDVSLRTQPTATVEVLVSNISPTEGSAGPLTLFFDDTNWDVPQILTITGLDDLVVDGAQTYPATLTTDSTDPDYDALVEQIAVTNSDNDGAAIDISPLNLTVMEGASTTFDVQLSSDPGTTVTFDLASSDPTQATVSASSLSFDSTNWNVARTVSVTAINDALCGEGNLNITITTAAVVSTAPAWSGLNPPDVSVLVLDSALCDVSVQPTSGLQVSEAGGTADFTVVLTGQPTSNVTIDFTSSNTGEGTVSPASVTFAPIDWQVPRTITVTGVDDACPDGDVQFSIVTSLTTTDPAFQGVNPADVDVTNTNDDAPAIIYTPAIGFPHTTTEAGGTASFTVALVAPGCPGPTSNVLIPLSVTDDTEATVMPASLTFTSANADVPQAVTVTGLDDTDVDGTIPFLVVLDDIVSQDSNWNAIDPPNVPMQNTDDD